MVIPEIEKAKNVFNDANKLYNDILFRYVNLSSTKRELINYNRLQLSKGIKSNGKLITPFYASIFYKGRISPVDLKDTGSFYRSFKVAILNNTDIFIHIYATDPKTPKLEFKYSKEIFGLTDSNVELFAQNFITYFLTEISKEIINRI